MQNIVEKYAVEAADEATDEGVVAIEYVLVAGFVALGVAVAFGTGMWDTMLAKLNSIITS
jgi:Flp pilus assembly pilin Flp